MPKSKAKISVRTRRSGVKKKPDVLKDGGTVYVRDKKGKLQKLDIPKAG